MFGFVKALAEAHGQKAIQRVTDAIVDLDPATATEAQLHMMEQALDKVGVELSKLLGNTRMKQRLNNAMTV